MDSQKESSNKSDKEAMDVNLCEPSEKGEIDATKESSNESDKQAMEVNPCEPSDKEAMDVGSFEPSDKNEISLSDEREKDNLQSQMKPQASHTKLQSTKRTFTKNSSSTSSDLPDDSLPAKKLILEVSGETVDSSFTKDCVSTANAPAVFSPGGSVPLNLSKVLLKSVKKVADFSTGPHFSVEENARKLLSSGERFYSERAQRFYSVYIDESKKYEEVRNARCLYSNKYKAYLGLKYFVYPLSHILMKDILDLVDFFNGTDAHTIPDNIDNFNPEFHPKEWKLQFVRPHFEVGIMQMEALVVNQLEMEFDKLVLEKLFGAQSNNKLDHTFFQDQTTEKIKLEYKLQPCQIDDDLDFLVHTLNLRNNHTGRYFKVIRLNLISLLEHFNICQTESVQINASRLIIDIFWVLRKLAKMRKIVIRLLKLESNKYSSLGTTYILKVKFHALAYFNALLLKFSHKMKVFRYDKSLKNF